MGFAVYVMATRKIVIVMVSYFKFENYIFLYVELTHYCITVQHRFFDDVLYALTGYIIFLR